MHLRARVLAVSIATLLAVILIAATAVPAAWAENRNDSRHDSHDSRHDGNEQAGSKLVRLQRAIDALKAELAAAKAASLAADAALQQQITTLAARMSGPGTSPAGQSYTSVFDTSGKTVGQVIGVDRDNIPWVVLTAHDASAQNYTFALKVFPGQLTGGTVLFSGPNCTGTAYIQPLSVVLGVYFGPSAMSIAGVDYVHGGVVYAAVAGAPVTAVDLSSQARDDGSCFAGPFGFPGANVVQAAPVTFNATFTPPYSVR